LSKKVVATSNQTNLQDKIFGVIPYIDPKIFNRQENNDDNQQKYSLNEKSDIYSVGVLLWEISSGRPPFSVEDEKYDICLALKISQGHRETAVPDTPENYLKVYTSK
jgi:hypothetical protein